MILGIYLSLLSIALLLVMRSDALTGRVCLLSTRNWFIAGLLLFQTISGATTLFLNLTEERVELDYPLASSLGFCVLLTVFTILFLWFYRKFDWPARLAHRRVRIRNDSLPRLVMAGTLLVGLGAVLRFGGSQVPYVAILLPQLAAGCLTGGCILVAIAWARSRFNLLIAVVLLALTVLSGSALIVGAFGRRELVGLMFGMIWGLYMAKWRFLPVAWFIPRATAAASVLLVVFLLFSGARQSGENVDRSFSTQIERIVSVDPDQVQEHLIASAVGQFAGGISMWTLENRVLDGGVYPLHSLVYFVTMPIPRDFWPDKPLGLGLQLVKEAGVTGVSDEHSWGPGLVGHIAHDFIPLSLPLYAFLLAIGFRYMDERTEVSHSDPLTIAIYGSALGQILGMPRGDLGLFTWQMMCAFTGVWLIGGLIASFVMPRDRMAEAAASEDVEEFDGSIPEELDREEGALSPIGAPHEFGARG